MTRDDLIEIINDNSEFEHTRQSILDAIDLYVKALLKQCSVSGSLPHPCVDPLFEIKGCDMPKGSCMACGGNNS